MDPVTVGIISVAVLFALILLGLHVGVALMLTSFLGVYVITDRFSVAASLLKQTAYSAVADYVFAVIPLFVLMGLLTTAAGATRDLFSAAESMLYRVKGGLGIATVVANAIFAAITGVSVASAAVFSKLAIPEMLRLRYNLRFSLGIVASSALLGMLIPPSVLMIVYGVVTEQSIGKLFAAGVGPGLLVAGLLSLAIWLMVVLKPELGGMSAMPRPAGVETKKWRIIGRPWPLYLLIALVLGGIYGGIFTPTEAGAIGAFGGLIIFIMRGTFTFRGALELLMDTGRASAGIFFLFIAASMYSRMLSLSQLPTFVADWVIAQNVPAMAVLAGFIVMLLILGCIIDSVSIILLTIPIMAPVMTTLGFDLIWFGMVAIVTVEIGLLTPPFGMVVFAMKSSLPPEITLEDIYAGSAPFMVVLLVALAIIIFVPQISLFLPNLLFG